MRPFYTSIHTRDYPARRQLRFLNGSARIPLLPMNVTNSGTRTPRLLPECYDISMRTPLQDFVRGLVVLPILACEIMLILARWPFKMLRRYRAIL